VSSHSRRTKRTRHTLRLWAFDQARAAVPYITSVVRSLREHALAVQSLQRRLDALENRPGRPDRAVLIERDELRRERGRAEDDLQQATEELEALDVYLLDALRGLVLVPFAHDDQLAWYVFDLFDDQPIRSWRYQSDPEETRRKLTAAQMS
jgi:hypothetical protein